MSLFPFILLKSSFYLLDLTKITYQKFIISILNSLTPNTAVIQTSFMYPKLNMDGFSDVNCSLGYEDGTRKVE